ncbi:hypothetical protein Tco_0024541 [Tanacetum coccineum]
MPPRMRTRSVGRPAVESLGGRTGEQVSSGGRDRRPREGNDERVDELNGRGNDQVRGANGGVEGANGNVGEPMGVHPTSQRSLPSNCETSYPPCWPRLVLHLVTPESRMLERYVYGLAPQIRGMVAGTEPKTMQKAVQIFGALTDEAVRNGTI